MKIRKLYEIRRYPDNHPLQSSSSVSYNQKLRPYTRARKLARYLKTRYGMKAFSASISVTRA